MEEILIQIEKSIKDFNSIEVKSLTEKALNSKIDPVVILDLFNNVLKEIGDAYQKGELFLPELVGAASTVDGSMSIVVDEIIKAGKQIKSMGKVAIGTVFGDIHSIGKTMVATLLTAAGFTIIDLGINVSAEKFVEVVEKSDVDMLAMSALLTTTAPEQEKVIELLKQKKLRDKVKIIVGGGAITKEFADNIGADGYGPSAPAAVSLAKTLLGRI
jgi:methylmalonyl-CoA mutase cobalamin-binding domain/chain